MQSKFDKLQNEAISHNQNDDLNDEFDYENDEIKRESFEEPLNVSIGSQEDFEFEEDEEIVQGETIHDTGNETIVGIIRDFTTCKICSITFKRKVHLEAHRRIHKGKCGKHPPLRFQTEEKPVQFKLVFCKSCPKSFAHMKDLENHEKIHIMERTHKCHFCEKCSMTLVIIKIMKDHTKVNILILSIS